MSEAPQPLAPPPGRRHVLLGLTVAAALAGFAAFPPLDLGALGWLFPIPLLLVLGQVRPREGFWHGWLFGTVFTAGTMLHIGKYGFLPLAALSAAVGLCFGAFGVVASLLRHSRPLWRVPALAGAWFLLELLRGHLGSIAFTFGDLAYSQYQQLGLIQVASLVGHYGMGFLMALLASGVATVLLAMLPSTWWRPGVLAAFNKEAGRVAVACFFLVFIAFFAGEYLVREGGKRLQQQAAAQGVRVAAIQAEGSVLGRQRLSGEDDLRLYLAQSRKVSADLIVWPETAVLPPLNLSRRSQAELSALAREKQANLLIGATENEGGRIHNSAFYYRPDGSLAGLYRKMDLVIFGEYVPYRHQVKFFQRYPIRAFDYWPGSRREAFRTPRYSFSPLICFEGIFPDPAREVARLGADLIVILTSDAWAEGTAEIVHHSHMTPFRAIEARKYVVRAASNGRSQILDPYGNALAQVDLYRDGSAVAAVLPRPGLSVYHLAGDLPLLVLGSLLVLGGLLASSAAARRESAAA